MLEFLCLFAMVLSVIAINRSSSKADRRVELENKFIALQQEVSRLRSQILTLQRKLNDQGTIAATEEPDSKSETTSQTSSENPIGSKTAQHEVSTSHASTDIASPDVSSKVTGLDATSPMSRNDRPSQATQLSQADSVADTATNKNSAPSNNNSNVAANVVDHATPPSQHAKTSTTKQSKPKPEAPNETSLNVVTSVLESVKNWFTGGNLIVRLGVIVLLVGVVLLLRLASDYFDTPIELRLGLIALGGLALTGVGLKLVKKRRNYGLSLQGGGLAVIYLTLFASFRLYHVLPSLLTFILLACLAAVTAFLSVRQNALPLALLGFGGAFLAPILTSDNSGSVVGLFSYYLLINVALAWVAHFRAWKLLNLLGVGVTFGLAYVWGANVFNAGSSDEVLSEVRWQLVGLLALHMVLYVFIAVRYTQQLVTAQQDKRLATSAPPVDASLLFGVPIMGFGLLAGLLHDMPYTLAIASAILSAVYLCLGNYLVRQSKAYRLMTEGTLALGISFLALVIPLALSAKWTAVGWSVQGAALVWLGVRAGRKWSVLFGLALQVLSMGTWFWLLLYGEDNLKLAIVVITTAMMVSAYLLRLTDSVLVMFASDKVTSNISQNTESLTLFQHKKNHQLVSYAVLGMASFVLLCTLSYLMLDWSWLTRKLDDSVVLGVIFCTMLAIYYLLTVRLRWREVAMLSRIILPLFGFALCVTLLDLTSRDITYFHYELSNFVVTLVMIAFGFIGLGLLWFKHWKHLVMHTRINQLVWLLCLVAMLVLLSGYCSEALRDLIVMVIPSIVLTALTYVALNRVSAGKVSAGDDAQSPTANERQAKQTAYLSWLSLPALNLPRTLLDAAMLLVPIAVFWLFVINYTSSGQYVELPYLPVLSLLDVSLLVTTVYLLATGYLYQQHQKHFHKPAKHHPKNYQPDWFGDNKMLIMSGMGALGFWVVTSMLVRSLHQFSGTPTWVMGAWGNDMVQTALTILWISLALVLTIIASRRFWREVWLVGIGLLGLVLIKLVVIDLSNSSALLRVISFMVAGLFMLVIGYFAPLPPKSESD